MLKAAVSGVALLLLFPLGAHADNVTPDGDIAVSSNEVTLVGACSLPSGEVAGRVEVKRTGNQHFQPGASASVAYTASSSQVSVTGPAQVTIPTEFAANGASSSFMFDIRTRVLAGPPVGTAAVRVVVSSGGYSAEGSYPVSWNCGSANTAPTVTVTGVTDGAAYEFGAVPVAMCDVVDAQDGSRSFAATLSPLSGPRADAGLGTQTAACSATDAGGLSGSAGATYTVVDTTPPVLPALTPVTEEATSAAGAEVDFDIADALDAVDGPVQVGCAPASGSIFALGSTAVMCSAVDSAGNRAEDTFTVTVADTTAPTLHLPDSVTLHATSTAGAPFTYTATADDAVDPDIVVDCNPPSGATFAFGPTTVTCAASDTAGHQTTGSFVITVQDVTGPTVHVPADATLEATGPSGAPHTFTASAEDDIDGPLPVTCTPASGSTFALDQTTAVTCSATDNHGNPGSASFVVTVVDSTPPALSLPDDLVLEAAGPTGAVAVFTVSALDTVDGAVGVTCSATSGGEFVLGETPVNCTAVDNHGNPVSGTFTVTVRDTTAPVMPSYTDLVDVEATGPDGAVVTFDAGIANDLVDLDIPVTCTPQPGSVFALGTTTVTCTATDDSDNTGEAEFTVGVVDTTAPELDLPPSTVIEATGPQTPITYADVTATDVVDGDSTATCVPASGSSHGLGVVTVTCEATDAAGNTATDQFTVTIQDTAPPVVQPLEQRRIEATSAAGAIVEFGPVSAVDTVDGELAASCDPPSGTVFPLGETVVTCAAVDASGNRGYNGFTVTVEDTTAPTLTVPGPIAVPAVSADGSPVAFTVGALDAVDASPDVACTADGAPVTSGATFPLGATTVRCTATDDAGNSGSATFTVSVTVAWGGFLQPLNPGGPTAFKLNSTIPVKFRLAGASAGITGLDARLYVRRVDGTTDALTEVPATSTAAASTGNAFRWDADGQQYIFNLSTKALGAAGTYELRVDLGDGVLHTIQVVIRK
jgi:hypothetical protein